MDIFAMLDAWQIAERRNILNRLMEFVRFDTQSPNEESCHAWLESYVREAGLVPCRELVHPETSRHPYFSGLSHISTSSTRANLTAQLEEPLPGAPRLLISGHLDVVPPSPKEGAVGFIPKIYGDFVMGRGVVDTKGNIVMAIEALRFLQCIGVKPAMDVIFDFVLEEEIGGAGALSTLIHGRQADMALVLEPTGMEIFKGHRGALGVEVEVVGESTHMGGDTVPSSAIDSAYDAIKALKVLEAEMLEEARLDPDFSKWARPLQINVGKISGGEWHGSVAERCILQCNVGYLPRYDLKVMEDKVRQALAGSPNRHLHDLGSVRFTGLKNEAYVSPSNSFAITAMLDALKRQGLPAEQPKCWNASCDARLYSRLAGIPSVIFGCGNLAEAHSAKEKLSITQLMSGMRVIVDLLLQTEATK